VLAALNTIVGVRTYSSEANFILFRVAKATQVFEGLKQRGVTDQELEQRASGIDRLPARHGGNAGREQKFCCRTARHH